MNERENANFSWHAEVGDREMRGMAANAVERDSRQQSAVYLMKRDPQAGTLKKK
ncbi:hypothetical protein [Pseudorhodoplanes sinuspersici]|uniref:hypothetical protein n=1 Tax=Pseudorhodoplanes sinuspersici TaxID=1235591 RepID=UPI000FF213B8|nr:hypothetical protein [Pseudorhodoplanes sinuspersici]RKE66009.1 hypothetical protein DFP91_5583 [Pseudorhodoplanes sinuspersici]